MLFTRKHIDFLHFISTIFHKNKEINYCTPGCARRYTRMQTIATSGCKKCHYGGLKHNKQRISQKKQLFYALFPGISSKKQICVLHSGLIRKVKRTDFKTKITISCDFNPVLRHKRPAFRVNLKKYNLQHYLYKNLIINILCARLHFFAMTVDDS